MANTLKITQLKKQGSEKDKSEPCFILHTHKTTGNTIYIVLPRLHLLYRSKETKL